VIQATEAYRDEVDPVSDFIADCCLEDPDATEKFSDLYADYCDWSKKYSEKLISAKAFGQALDRKGFALDRKPGVRCRKGLKRGQEPLAEQLLDTAYRA
jgi:putative DNA primase/helicase